VARAVALAKASLGELEVSAEGFALVVNEMAELAAGAERRLSVAKCFLAALRHVRMGPTEAYEAAGLGLVTRTGTKGM